MNGFGGTAPQGVEAELFLDLSTADPSATIGTIKGGFGVLRMTRDADSVVVVIPFSHLDDDDGNMTITAIVGPLDRPTDFAPNSDVLVSHVPAALRASAAMRAKAPAGSSRAAAAQSGSTLRGSPWKVGPPPR
jgi:hypothetical protein